MVSQCFKRVSYVKVSKNFRFRNHSCSKLWLLISIIAKTMEKVDVVHRIQQQIPNFVLMSQLYCFDE